MEWKYLIMIIAMAFVTFIPRYIPLAVLSKFEIPKIIVDWLRFIPPAILAALLVPGILMSNGKLLLTQQNTFLLAALPTTMVAIYKRNIFLTVLVGMLMILLLEYLL